MPRLTNTTETTNTTMWAAIHFGVSRARKIQVRVSAGQDLRIQAAWPPRSDLNGLELVDVLDGDLLRHHFEAGTPAVGRLPESSLHRTANPDPSTRLRAARR